MLIARARQTRRSFLRGSGNALGAMFLAPTAYTDLVGRPGGESREAILREFYDAYAALDLARLLSLLTEDCFFEDPTFHLAARGKPEIRKMAEDLPRHYSDLKIVVENRITCQDWAVTQQQVSGLFRAGGGEGKRIAVRGATIFGFEKDRINRWTDYYDYATFIKQTGSRTGG